MAAGSAISPTGQIGDGREAAAVDYVLAHAGAGNILSDAGHHRPFAYEKSMLINVVTKGTLLDAAVQYFRPALALGWGTASATALHIARAAPEARCTPSTRRSQRQQRPAKYGRMPASMTGWCISGTIATVGAPWTR